MFLLDELKNIHVDPERIQWHKQTIFRITHLFIVEQPLEQADNCYLFGLSAEETSRTTFFVIPLNDALDYSSHQSFTSLTKAPLKTFRSKYS